MGRSPQNGRIRNLGHTIELHSITTSNNPMLIDELGLAEQITKYQLPCRD